MHRLQELIELIELNWFIAKIIRRSLSNIKRIICACMIYARVGLTAVHQTAVGLLELRLPLLRRMEVHCNLVVKILVRI